MAKVLTGPEVQEILDECCANGEFSSYQEGPEFFWQMPSSLGSGYGREMLLRPGLWLEISDLKKRQTHTYKFQHTPIRPLGLTFYLSGGSRVDNGGLAGVQEEMAGKSYLYCLPNTPEIEEYPANKIIRRIKILILPELIPTFSDRIHELPSELRTAIEHPEKALLYYSSLITPAQQQILQQILQWPYQGITRQFYLEAKVLELIALHFNQMLAKSLTQSKSLITRDIDRVYQARDILIQNMVNPPSLSELAKQVQLNERKLKQGFRQVFDNTIFGYLHDHRMEQARQLLQAGQLNIQETARWVGYASRSSFVVAFKKKFKVSPSRYLKDAV
ncbi:MAG: AraC family transcriptional regulator [Cyanobacteria bacterium P01_F01_bin.116]